MHLLFVIDDAPGAVQEWLAQLRARGYCVHCARNLFEAEQLLRQNQIGLLLHAAVQAKTDWQAFDLMLAPYPDLPVLHLRTPDAYGNSDPRQSHDRGGFAGLPPLQKLLAQVDRFFGPRDLRDPDPDRHGKDDKWTIWSRQFSSLDFAQTLDVSARCLSQEFAADVVMWIPGSQWKEFLNRAPVEESLLFAQRTRLCEGVHVWPNREHLAWPETLGQWRQCAQPSSDLVVNQAQTLRRGERRDVVIPLAHIRDGQVMGHLVALGARRWPASVDEVGEVDEKGIQGLVALLQKHWSFCFDYDRSNERVFFDDLTPLYNQRYLPVALDQEIHRSHRGGEAFSVLFLDLDYFKGVNDSFGHLVGSRVLIEVGKLLHKNLRVTDYGFRYGGDEFVAVLSATDGAGAQFFAERLRKMIENTEFEVLGNRVKITVSVGVASYPQSASSALELLRLADKAMYSSKSRGRNQVYSAS